MTFGKLSDMIENAEGLEVYPALRFAIGQDVALDLIEYLNTRAQLFDKGEDATGRDLMDIGGEYTEFTREQKRRKGLPDNYVTLFDTGDFYRSFRVEAQATAVEIEANTMKEGTDLRARWGDEILGLQDESITELSEVVAVFVADYLREQLLR